MDSKYFKCMTGQCIRYNKITFYAKEIPEEPTCKYCNIPYEVYIPDEKE